MCISYKYSYIAYQSSSEKFNLHCMIIPLFPCVGFSTEDYDPDAPSSYRGGNKVFLQRDLLTLDCPIVHHYTNDEQIVCIAP